MLDKIMSIDMAVSCQLKKKKAISTKEKMEENNKLRFDIKSFLG